MNKSMRSMIKRVVIPNNTDIHIMVPQAYVGKKVELILFTLDETDEEQNILPTKSIHASNGIVFITAA